MSERIDKSIVPACIGIIISCSILLLGLYYFVIYPFNFNFETNILNYYYTFQYIIILLIVYLIYALILDLIIIRKTFILDFIKCTAILFMGLYILLSFNTIYSNEIFANFITFLLVLFLC